MDFLLTTETGLEELAAEELLERWPGARVQATPYGIPGRVRVGLDSAEGLCEMSTIHHVIEVCGEAEVATLADIRRVVERLDVPDLIHAASFRVTTERSGLLDFTRRQIQGAAGAVLQKRYGTPVDLSAFELNVRVDLHGAHLCVGVQRTGKSLGKRIKRAKPLRTSIKPITAAAMVRLAGAHRGMGRLIDPLCGTGNIPIEAKRINPLLEVHASDWDGPTVDVARETIANHDLAIQVRVADARGMRRVYPHPFDYIVTDPPYGVRLGRRSGIADLYRALIPSWEECLANHGTIVLAVVKYRTFVSALAGSGFTVSSTRAVGSGDLRPTLVVLKRR